MTNTAPITEEAYTPKSLETLARAEAEKARQAARRGQVALRAYEVMLALQDNAQTGGITNNRVREYGIYPTGHTDHHFDVPAGKMSGRVTSLDGRQDTFIDTYDVLPSGSGGSFQQRAVQIHADPESGAVTAVDLNGYEAALNVPPEYVVGLAKLVMDQPDVVYAGRSGDDSE